MTRLALVAFALGAGLLLVERTLTVVLGVALLLAAIVLGTFAIATPEALAAEVDEDDPDGPLALATPEAPARDGEGDREGSR